MTNYKNHPIHLFAKNNINLLSTIDKSVIFTVINNDVITLKELHLIFTVIKNNKLNTTDLIFPLDLEQKQELISLPYDKHNDYLTINVKENTIYSKFKSTNTQTFLEIVEIHKTLGFHFDKIGKFWYKKFKRESFVELITNDSCKKLHITYPQDAKQYIENVIQEKARALNMSYANNIELDIPEINNILYPFQRVGIKYMDVIGKKSVLIADEMGLGKTLQALGIIQYKKAVPCIILCPAMVKLNWEKEINKWFTNKKIQILYGNKSIINKDSEYIILNYDIIKNYYKQIVDLNPKSIICDEFHFLKNYKSMRTSIVLDYFHNIEYKILLSGTPIINRPTELLPLLEFTNLLKTLGGKTYFKNRYCGIFFNGYEMVYGKPRNSEELQKKLRENLMIRRLKSDVMTDLPEKIRQELIIEMTDYKEYEAAEKNLIKWYKDKLQKEKLLTEIEKKILQEQGEYVSLEMEGLAKIEYLKQACIQYKLKDVYIWIDDFLLQKNKLVVFAHHRNIIQELHGKYKTNSLMLIGGMQNEIQDIIHEYQTNDNINILFVSLMAGGFGIDGLQDVCSDVLFIEYPWTEATLDQAESRVHRNGQKNVVNITYLLGKNTIDSYVWDIIKEKEKMSNKTMNIKFLLDKINDKITK